MRVVDGGDRGLLTACRDARCRERTRGQFHQFEALAEVPAVLLREPLVVKAQVHRARRRTRSGGGEHHAGHAQSTSARVVVSPELADVLSAIICRVRDRTGKIPMVSAYDDKERVWMPPAPLLFQRRFGFEDRAINAGAIRDLLGGALVHTGLTDTATGQSLHFTPHDFRRLFITDAILSGLPPHIAQVIAGHKDINVTMGYKAVYPEEAIQAHLAFLARRRALRPGDEYRVPTEQEWTEFLGHFERRKVSTGTCGRAFGTPCIHEHSCLRCPLHWPDPSQRNRIQEIRDNLIARIAEAEREGWLGEVEGLRVSLAGAEDKLGQIDRRPRHSATVDLGLPAARNEER